MPSFFSNDYPKLIGYLIEASKKRHIRQTQLAEAMRIEQTLISRMERCERRIDAVEFYHICGLPGPTPDEIYRHLTPRFSTLEPVKK